MIKLLIIDDETSTRKGLIRHIDWDALGIAAVEEAKDGIDGLEAARVFLPDIILSDICMPGMNGIELAAGVKAFLPDCRLIFLSGYSDKEYLKAAIHLSAVSYIEKPINLEEVRHAIGKAVAMCVGDREKKLADKQMISALAGSLPLIKQNVVAGLIGQKTAFNDLARELGLIGVPFEGKDCYTAMILQLALSGNQSGEESQAAAGELLQLLDESLCDIKHICAMEDNRRIHAVLSFAATQDRNRLVTSFHAMKARLKERFPACAGVFCAVGQTVMGADHIRQSYQTAESALQKLFFLGYGQIVCYESRAEDPICLSEGIYSHFAELLQTQDRERTIPFIENLCRELNLHRETDVDEVKNIFFKLALALFREAEKRGVGLSDAQGNRERYIWAQISSFETMQEIRDYLAGKTALLFENIEEFESNSRAIADVMKYIQKHYAACELSNKTLAESVYLTPTYLSTLFKKETGKTIGEYLIEVRIEKSKELLKEPRVKLFEVARNVGYSDANYYAKAFKKQTGMTPSEFRERYQ